MLTVTDSKVEPLPAPTVITTVVGELDLKGVSVEAAMISIVEEMNMEDADMVQIGNTVFLGHRGKGDNEDLMYGRAFNIDTAQNFIANGLRYFTYMQRKGIKRYISDYDGDVYDSAFKTWKRYTDKGDSEVAVGRKADGGSRAYVTLGKIPLSEIM
tara:strand:+ start:42 stop:509 length:468 start_codon:yes stop_codon:yes gene_type:complete